MNDRDENSEDYRSLQLLDEISRSNELTQRDLSRRLGVALGLVNSYIKNLVSKGFVTVSTIPRNRYRYFLTPSGLSEKTRLTYRHLQNFTGLYRVARRDFRALFAGLLEEGAGPVVFCGLDEVTEIAYLSLKECGGELKAVLDDDSAGGEFFGHRVLPVSEIEETGYGVVVITSFAGGGELKRALARAGVDERRVRDISADGWIKRINPEGDTDEEV